MSILIYPNHVTNLNQDHNKFRCLPFHNISLTTFFVLYISCIPFFWNQPHHTQQQPGVQIWYNCAMFSYFNSTFYKHFYGSYVACLSYVESVTRPSVVLITEHSYCSLSTVPVSMLWTSHLSIINHPLKTLSVFLLPVMSLQIQNASLILYWLET